MGSEKDWQKQLLNAALMAASRSAIQYMTNPNSRKEAVEDVKSSLAEVDYSAAARAVSQAIDRLAETSKVALNDAIDAIRENAEEVVEAAAEKAQTQLGVPQKKRGRGKLLWGIILGAVIGFILLNEDRRNQLMDKFTGASGPIDGSQWATISPTPTPASAPVAEPAASTAEVSPASEPTAEATTEVIQEEAKKTKTATDNKKEPAADS